MSRPRERRSVVAASSRSGPTRSSGSTAAGSSPASPGQFFMLEAPGRLLPRPMSLCLAPRGRARVPDRPDRARDAGARASSSRASASTSSARSATASGSTSTRPLLVGGGIGIAPLPYLSEALARPPAVLGFRIGAARRGGRARAERRGRDRPGARHRAASPASRDVLACGPEPMLEAVRALAPGAQLAWEAPMACGYGACYGCVGRDRRRAASGSASRGRSWRLREAPERQRLPRRADRARGRARARRVRDEDGDAAAARGQSAAADRRDRRTGCSTRSGSRIPAATASSPRRCRGSPSSASRSGSRSAASPRHEYAETCARLDERPTSRRSS